MNKTYNARRRRKLRVRSRVRGTSERPRLSVFRSNRYICAQVIDDMTGRTVSAACGKCVEGEIPKEARTVRIEEARAVGKCIAKRALKAGIANVVFDRGRYRFHGRVRACAEGAREAGLKF